MAAGCFRAAQFRLQSLLVLLSTAAHFRQPLLNRLLFGIFLLAHQLGFFPRRVALLTQQVRFLLASLDGLRQRVALLFQLLMRGIELTTLVGQQARLLLPHLLFQCVYLLIVVAMPLSQQELSLAFPGEPLLAQGFHPRADGVALLTE